jgi:hypothetical protein
MPRFASAFPFALAALGLALLGTLPGCADEAQFSSRFATDFVHGRHTVSVLGVFKDGQMSSDAWESIGTRLSAPFGATCQTGYGQLITSNPPLSAAIEDYVRANGPGDELLEQLAPAASGDLVVVFTVAGHVGPKPTNTPDTSNVSGGAASGAGAGSAPMGASGGKYRGMRPGSGGNVRGLGRPTNAAFEVSASFYSVSEKKAVGFVAMQYDGTSLDEAFQRMSAKVAAAVPGSACAGWDWKAQVDDNRIRALTEH